MNLNNNFTNPLYYYFNNVWKCLDKIFNWIVQHKCKVDRRWKSFLELVIISQLKIKN